MSNLVPTNRTDLLQRQSGMGQVQQLTGHTRKALVQMQQRRVLRSAGVHLESSIAVAKGKELGYVCREGMTDNAMLHGWAKTLAAGDPLLEEDMRFYVEMHRVGSGEIIADLIDTFCGEGRS
jgi:hypothetical protein